MSVTELELGENYMTDTFEYKCLTSESKGTFLFHLMYHEGPLSSVFSYDDNHVIIFDWISSEPEKSGHRWVKAIIEKENVSRYIYGAITFREIFELSATATSYSDIIIGDDAIEIASEKKPISALLSDPDYGNYKYDPNYTTDDDKVKAWMLSNSRSFDVDPSYELTISVNDLETVTFACENHYQYALIARDCEWLEAA